MILSIDLKLSKLMDLSIKEAFLNGRGGNYLAKESSITHLAIRIVLLQLLNISKKRMRRKSGKKKNNEDNKLSRRYS